MRRGVRQTSFPALSSRLIPKTCCLSLAPNVTLVFRFLHSSPSHRHTCFGLFIDYVMRQHSHRSLSTYFMHKMYEKITKRISFMFNMWNAFWPLYFGINSSNNTLNRFVDKVNVAQLASLVAKYQSCCGD